MKVNFLKSKKIVTFTILALIGLLGMVFVLNMKTLTTIEVVDNYSAEIIRKCVTTYIVETDDYELKFGESKSVLDVKELLNKLTFKVSIKGEKYGPYLLKITDDIKMPPSNKRKNGNKGWKIVINKSKAPMDAVSVEPSKSNMIQYVGG